MDGFSYYNIFQTKGIEYIIIIAFLLMLIPFWMVINRKSKVVETIRQALQVLTLDMLKIPSGIFFNRKHTWTYLERSGKAQVGLDDLLLHLAGDVSFTQLHDPGEFIRKGEVMAELEQGDKVLKVYAPISGRISEVNPILDSRPAVIADDPYTQGWIYRMEPSNWQAETDTYLWGKETRVWFRKELDRFKDFLMVSAARNMPETSLVTLQEGGELIDHTLSTLPVEVWEDFQKEFLDE